MPRFAAPESDYDSSPPPSTPARGSRNGGTNSFNFGREPSTTPAGPPPSSSGSFTPAGAPSASYLGSSMMRGVTSHKSDTKNTISSKNSSTRSSKASSRAPTSKYRPSPSSRYGRSQQRQPSRLSKQIVVSDEEDEEEEDDEDKEMESGGIIFRKNHAFNKSSLFRHSEMSQGGPDLGNSLRWRLVGLSDADVEQASRDVWLDLDGTQDLPSSDDTSNMLDLVTPEVDEKVRQHAESILRASQMNTERSTHKLKFSMIAKSIYEQMGYAPVTEAPLMILNTEAAVSKLYDEGVGSTEDTDRLDNTLARTSAHLVHIWSDYGNMLSKLEEDHQACIGPSPNATSFEHALYLARLALQMHHTQSLDGPQMAMEPLTETMFRWLLQNHNIYPDQAQDVQRYRPSPASHSMYWQTVFITLLQGRVSQAIDLLSMGGWERVTRDRQPAYTGRALENVQRAIRDISAVLDTCPGKAGDWEIWNSDWTLFRIRARAAREQLRKFAEGKGSGNPEFEDSSRSRSSMTGMARKAKSQVPWDIYENINIIFDIILGSKDRILTICQDWVEASVGLLGWWDEKKARDNRKSLSRSLVSSRLDTSTTKAYLERLARCFHVAVEAGLEVNSNNPIEVGTASIFEGNAEGAIGIIRAWSLPVASAVAEIASLGGWLPVHVELPKAMEEMDAADLDLLGVNLGSPDELDGFKDNTLVQYAQALVNSDDLGKCTDTSGHRMEGWELAINVLGRMDSRVRSEEVVGEMVRAVIENLTPDSGNTVEKVWKLLNNLGMIAFAEETAEHYGEILSQESHRYGEAMWYYALAHRPTKVCEVMNLLISYSLINSSAYPVDTDLDGHLRKLLDERNTTLEHFAKQDLKAAELLGKMLSGYATLRRFYEIRDEHDDTPLPHRQPAAAQALTAVIASADDNIRGGLYDPNRDAVVSEDFLLALLGEALPFVNSTKNTHDKTRLSADAITTLLKAVEDIQTVGSRVYAACDDFFSVVLHNAPGLRGGATPADLMHMSTSGTGSYVLTGGSMLASQLHKSIGPGGKGGGKDVKRGWDWRAGLTAATKSEDVLRMIRLGLTRDLARLWIEEADEGRAF